MSLRNNENKNKRKGKNTKSNKNSTHSSLSKKRKTNNTMKTNDNNNNNKLLIQSVRDDANKASLLQHLMSTLILFNTDCLYFALCTSSFNSDVLAFSFAL